MRNGLHADVILRNGPIYTAYGQPYAEALAVRKGRVVAVGSADSLDGLRGAETAMIDLAGRMALPAFNDCHLHMIMLGRSLVEIKLGPTHVRSIPEAVEKIRQQAAATKPGEWIYGGRYDHFELAEKRHPTMAELDAAAPNNPVYIARCCGHVGVGNSRAFAAAGISGTTPDPEGGHIERRDGKLTGQLQENAQKLVLKAMPALTLEEAVAAIEGASSHLLSFGVASVMDAGVGLNGRLLDMAAFQAARRSGRLPLRVYLALLAGPDGILDECYAAGLVTGAGDEFLKIGPAKLFADGSIGGHTAAMSLPYFNDRNNRGIFIYSDKEMQDLVADCMARGYQVATHAIGDAAIEQVLLAYERAMAGGHSELRHRIEHCGFGTNEQMRRLRDAGILPIPQPCFISHYGDVYADAVGAERTGASYPMRSWIENHMQPAASSDSPICPPDTLANLASMLTRKGPSGIIYGQDQTIDIERAIETMTYNGAYASHSEKYKGRLLPGQAADIAILDRDISALLPDEVSATKVDATIVAGHIAFDRLGACSG